MAVSEALPTCANSERWTKVQQSRPRIVLDERHCAMFRNRTSVIISGFNGRIGLRIDSCGASHNQFS
jgi:hypothetical protein